MTASWTSNRTWSSGEIVTAALLNTYIRDNLDYLKTPTESGKVQFAADFTTTSGSLVDVTGLTTSFTSDGSGVDIFLRLNLNNSSPAITKFVLVVDGAVTTYLGFHYNNSTTVYSSFSIFEHLAALAAGSHTIKIQCLVGGGTTTIRGTTGTNGDPLYFVRQCGA